jgi:hypothetical protein
VHRQLGQYLLAARGESYKNFTPVLGATGAGDETLLNQPVDEFDRAVMLNLHSLGEIDNASLFGWRFSLDGEHQLMVLRFDACNASGFFAEVEKAADLIAKLRQSLVVG